MSVKIIKQVWEKELPRDQQTVLLALAYHADDDGNNVFPSNELIAWRTDYSERQVQRIKRDLEASGILIVTAPANRHKPTTYRIDMSRTACKPPLERRKRARGDIAMSPLEDDVGVTFGDESGVTSHGKNDVVRGDIPSLNLPPKVLKDQSQKEKDRRSAFGAPDPQEPKAVTPAGAGGLSTFQKIQKTEKPQTRFEDSDREWLERESPDPSSVGLSFKATANLQASVSEVRVSPQKEARAGAGAAKSKADALAELCQSRSGAAYLRGGGSFEGFPNPAGLLGVAQALDDGNWSERAIEGCTRERLKKNPSYKFKFLLDDLPMYTEQKKAKPVSQPQIGNMDDPANCPPEMELGAWHLLTSEERRAATLRWQQIEYRVRSALLDREIPPDDLLRWIDGTPDERGEIVQRAEAEQKRRREEDAARRATGENRAHIFWVNKLHDHMRREGAGLDYVPFEDRVMRGDEARDTARHEALFGDEVRDALFEKAREMTREAATDDVLERLLTEARAALAARQTTPLVVPTAAGD